MIKKTVVLLVLSLLSIGAMFANPAPLCSAVGPMTLDMLLPGGSLADGCMIDDKLFGNFSYVIASQGGGVTVPSPSSITVTALDTPLNPGLRFTSAWAAGPGAFADSTLGYRVTVLPGGKAIEDASLLMAGGHTGTGIAAVDDVLCVGATLADNCAGGTLVTLHTASSSVGSIPLDHLTFRPGLMVDVLKDIGVFGGVAGTATITTFDQRYSEVPEPLSVLLMLTVSTPLAWVGFRRARRRA